MAPFIPSFPGVRTSSAPRCLRSFLLSTLMVSGMVRISRYFLAAQTKARAIPVFPLVGSIIKVFLPIRPCRSAASIMARPIRSLTLPRGFLNSNLARISACSPLEIQFSRTSGVDPIVFVTSVKISPTFRPPPFLEFRHVL